MILSVCDAGSLIYIFCDKMDGERFLMTFRWDGIQAELHAIHEDYADPEYEILYVSKKDKDKWHEVRIRLTLMIALERCYNDMWKARIKDEDICARLLKNINVMEHILKDEK